jgi:hypothetical protein
VSRRSAVLLAAAAAAVTAAIFVPLVAIDGGQPRLSRAQYAGRVNAIFAAVGERFRLAGSGGDAAAISASLRATKRALDMAASELARLRPPKDAEREHRLLLGAMRDYARQVDLLRASVDFGDPATIATHLREITAPAAIDRVLRKLSATGYRLRIRLTGPN